MSEKFDFEKVERRQKLLKSYIELSDKMEESYRKRDFKTAKNAGLAILKDTNALRDDGTFEDIFNPAVNKRIADYAILMLIEEGLDDLEKELLKGLFTYNVMNIDYVKKFINGPLSFEKTEYVVETFTFFREIGVVSKEEAESLIKNAQENDGAVIMPNPSEKVVREALKQDLLAFLAERQPIPQKDFVAAWRSTKPYSRVGNTSDVCIYLEEVFRSLVDEGKIRREKTGRAFTLFVSQGG